VFFIFRIGGIENQFLSSSVISTPSLEAMNKDQLQDYINQQQILLSQATSLTKTYQKNIDTARLLFDSLMYNTQFSACAVSYVYKKISEEMLTSNISTSSQSAATNSGVDDFSGDLTAKPTKKIQDSVDVDFIFSQPSLEAQYLNSANNVRLIYDRASRSIK
jgi:hypothetical protein